MQPLGLLLRGRLVEVGFVVVGAEGLVRPEAEAPRFSGLRSRSLLRGWCLLRWQVLWWDLLKLLLILLLLLLLIGLLLLVLVGRSRRRKVV